MAQMAASLLLPKSYRLTFITDWISFALLLSASLAFLQNAFTNGPRQRLVWILLGGAYAIETVGQALWTYSELVLKVTPSMSLGDASFFLAWNVLIMGFALRPHVELSKQHQRLGTLDLFVLLLAGLYLYLFLVIPWQYLSPEPHSYNLSYTFLALAEDVVLFSVIILGWRHSSGGWRRFYLVLVGIVGFDTAMEYFVDMVADRGTYFSGSWYDAVTSVAIAGMTVAALLARGLEPAAEHGDPVSERYWQWASRMAAPVTVVLPLFAAWSLLDSTLPASVWRFRVLLSLGAAVVFASVAIVKQARLEKELANANHDLLEASLTDLLTGVRNRRFFTNSIEADVQQVLRSFSDKNLSDARNRDMVFYLIDVDHFKKVNDKFGHQAGDQVLVEIARRINSAARLSDAVIRWGGEEFLLVSRYTDRREAHVLAKRVLDAVGAQPYRLGCGTKLDITCSIGWAAFPWLANEPRFVPHEQVLVLADYALYQAKGSGRNRAVGLLPAGGDTQASPAAASICVDAILASPFTTPGPELAKAPDVADLSAPGPASLHPATN